MGKLSKFENVDVIASLEAIMKQNTAFYQSDFEIDKRILREAASRPAAEEKRLPPVGDVLLPGTRRFPKGHKAA